MNILIIGYGKMGKAIEKLALKSGHEIFAIVKEKEPLKQKLIEDQKPDMAIEFTGPESGFENIYRCILAGIPVVSGTTGWLDKFDEIVNLVEREDGSFFYAPNYSIGMNIVFGLARTLGDQFKNFSGYDTFISESHHVEKLDKPSGSAIKLAEEFLNNNPVFKDWKLDEKTPDSLPIYSTREQDVVGTHRLSFENDLESFFVEHKAHDRNVFASGALKAAEFLNGKKGCFSMKDLLGF